MISGKELMSDLSAGAVTGAVSALPGASGSTVLVVFGIYERLVRAVSSLKNLASDARFLVTVLVGVVAGLYVCSIFLDFVMERWATAALFSFVPLILFQIPDIKAMDGHEGPAGAGWWIVAAVCAAAMAAIPFLSSGGPLEPSVPVMVAVGAVFAAMKILPGISGSTLLVVLGMYDAMLDAISSLDLSMLIPMGVGAVLAVILMAKAVTRLMSSHRHMAFGAITGLTVGSVAAVLEEGAMSMTGAGGLPAAAVGIAVGVVAGYGLMLMARRHRRESTAAGIGERRD